MTLRLLVVAHSRTGAAAAMAGAVVAGATSDEVGEVGEVDVIQRPALEAGADDVMAADGYVLVTPENFGYMSGAMKHFLDTVYDPCLDQTRGRPYGLVVKAGNDGTGAITAVERIVTGLGWRQALPPVLAVGDLTPAHLHACRELGATLAAGLALGIH